MLRRLFYILVLFLCTASALVAGDKSVDDDVWTADERKAGYFFLEACRRQQRGQADAYFELLQRAYEFDPSNSVIAYYLGYCKLFLARDDKSQDEAFDMMKNHIANHPESLKEARMYAHMNTRAGRYKEAVATFESIVKKYPANLNDKYSLARAYRLNREFANAIAVYDSIEAREGISQPVSIEKIEMYIAQLDTANTLREARKVYNIAPNSVESNEIMGNVYQVLGMYDSAYVYLDRMEQIEPDNGNVALVKAKFFYIVGDSVNLDKQMYKALTSENLDVELKADEFTKYIRQLIHDNDSSERVVNLFKVVTDQHPHEAVFRRLYGSYLVSRKDLPGAAEQFAYALDIEPDNVDDWKNRIIVLSMDGNYNEAIKAAQKALEFNPDDIDLSIYISSLYNQLGEPDMAIEIERTLIPKVKDDSRNLSVIYGNIGDAFYSKEMPDSAFYYYEKALEYDKLNIGILNNYAYFLAEADKELERAESMSAMAIKNEPDNSTYLDTYAWVLYKKGEYDLARLYIEKALNCNNNEPSAEMEEHYGDILFALKVYADAITHWNTAISLDPEREYLNKKIEEATSLLNE